MRHEGGCSEDHLQERRGSRAAARLFVYCPHRESHVLGAPAFGRGYFSEIWILAHFPHMFAALGPASSRTLGRTSVTRRVRMAGLTEGRTIRSDAQGRFNSRTSDAIWRAGCWGDILTASPAPAFSSRRISAASPGGTPYVPAAPGIGDGTPGRRGSRSRPPEPDRTPSTCRPPPGTGARSFGDYLQLVQSLRTKSGS